MSKSLRAYREELGWEQIILFIGFLSFFNFLFWIVQVFSYNISFDKKFISRRFWRITYYFGWFNTLALFLVILAESANF